jgi:4-amino-4-deoxy-L-arabinose transferase-like glycosyltransferase
MPYTKAFLLIVVVSGILLFVKLGSITVFQIAEARNSEVPAEMQNRHDYTVPYFNGELRADKSPLRYYAILFNYYIGGVNETSEPE